MIDKEAVTGALDAISDAINAQINALDFNHLCDLLEGGFNNEENCAEVVH